MTNSEIIDMLRKRLEAEGINTSDRVDFDGGVDSNGEYNFEPYKGTKAPPDIVA